MKKVIISIVFLVLIIIVGFGGYVFVQDQKIKKDLVNVNDAQFVEDQTSFDEIAFTSEVELKRENGAWATVKEGNFSIDTSSLQFEFTGYKPGGLHVGTFNNINAVIRLDDKGNPVATRIVVDASSVKTDAASLDTHLQGDDFFAVAQYPQIIVEIKKMESVNGLMNAITDITMKGVTRTVSIPVKFTSVENGTTFEVDSLIKISDFNIAYGPVQDDVRIVVKGLIKNK
jgi:polyisoprenoid-binding protein YceI